MTHALGITWHYLATIDFISLVEEESKDRTTVTMPLFVPLSTPRCTRLMRIHPGSFEDDIHADLFEINLNKPPEYEALSYTWGNETGLEPVYINGYHVLIRRNLFNFLRRLRYDDEPRVIWVDAISISQQDPVEKGQQVAMIGDIFRAAEQVCMWLGE